MSSARGSQMYQTINKTARGFVSSMKPSQKDTNKLDTSAIRSTLSPSFTVRWGPNAHVSTIPELQAKLDAEGFIQHLQSMAAVWKTWRSEVSGVCVDEHKKSAVVRCRMVFTSLVGESIGNDMIWILNTNSTGDKIMWACEYLDVAAIEGMKARVAESKASEEQTATIKKMGEQKAQLREMEEKMASLKGREEQMTALKKGLGHGLTPVKAGMGPTTPPATPIDAPQPVSPLF